MFPAMLCCLLVEWVVSSGAPSFQGINAITLATDDMAASVAFYGDGGLGMGLTYGGPAANFSTLGNVRPLMVCICDR